jgi:Holliday junction resolvasome RuvABC endonuclease subunit
MAKHRIERDPWVFAERLKRPAKSNLVLGLDLGTNCGYAFTYMRDGQRLDPEKLAMNLGQFDLSAGPYDSGAIRFVRLRQFLSVMEPDLIAFEDVKYTPAEKPNRFNAGAIVARAATACEWFGALKATVATWAEENGVPVASFPIGVIKKRATGKGNANKSDIIKACNALFGSDMDHKDYENAGYDNIADAAFVCLLTLEHYHAGLPTVGEADREQEELAPAVGLAVTSETPRKKARKSKLGRLQIPESEIP